MSHLIKTTLFANSAIFSYIANSVNLDEVAHYEPPHQALHCLRIQLFSSLAVKS